MSSDETVSSRREKDRAYYLRNQEQIREKQRAYYRANREAQAHRNRKSKYGVTEDQYNELLRTQDSVCAVCKEPETYTRAGKTKQLAIDHCHETGRVRGLLCHHCNLALGHLRDRLDLVQAAAEYLVRHAC